MFLWLHLSFCAAQAQERDVTHVGLGWGPKGLAMVGSVPAAVLGASHKKTLEYRTFKNLSLLFSSKCILSFFSSVPVSHLHMGRVLLTPASSASSSSYYYCCFLIYVSLAYLSC